MPRQARRISLLTVLAASTALLVATPLAAQSLYTGLALVAEGDIDEVGFRPAPDHDMPPPPGLERMSVGQALGEHLVGWMGGEAMVRAGGARVHGVVLNRGRVVRRFGPGETMEVSTGEAYLEEEEMQMIPARRFLSEDLMRSEVAEQGVQGYDLSTRVIPLAEVMEEPGRFIINGVFDSPREMRMGNVLALILAPEDREMMERSEGTVMLVMF